jgi:hypothetical protein
LRTTNTKITIMTWTDIFTKTGHFFQWTFKFMPKLGNMPNLFFWIIIVSLVVTWLRMQSKFNKEAKANNTIQ